MSDSLFAKEKATFLKYITNKKILIADTSASSRSGLFLVFKDLGVKLDQIIMVNSYNHADQAIEKEKPQVVLVEYDLNNRCGLELLQKHRQFNGPENKSSLFIIITNNSSQTAVARSAEEDVDAFILKPFTTESVCKLIIKTAFLKMVPPLYISKIEEGKNALAVGDFNKAEIIFNEAAMLDSSPSLAYYYSGQVNFFKKIIDNAKTNYKKGLEFNKIHYKCLVGLYDILMGQQQFSEAYDVVKKLSQYFPANPKRLSEVLRLAIVNGKYEDIEKYYSIFINIDERDEQLIKYVCAALIVCGKYYLSVSGGRTRALQLFQKAAATGTGRTKILCEIILSLIEHKLAKEAQAFLSRFPAETTTSDDYLLMQLLINEGLDSNRSVTLEQGRDLLKRGVTHKYLFAAMIRTEALVKHQEQAEMLLIDATKKYPELKDFFEKTLKDALKNSK